MASGRSRAIGLLCFLAATISIPPPAAAAPARVKPGAIPRWERPVPKGEAAAIRTLRGYAACVASAPEAKRLLQATPGTAEEAALLRILVRPPRNCRFIGRLNLQAYMFRGAIAELLYPGAAGRRSRALSPNSPAETPGAFTARLAAADRDGLGPVDRKIIAWRWMAYCAAHRDPAAAAALLRSPVSDPAEVAALRALRPALEACLPHERWADLWAVTIRALVAEALFRRLLAEG